MLIQFFDIAGVITFAISGALTAYYKRMDVFGIFIIAFTTAVGGGTLRDILIGVRPVSWMLNLNVVYVIMGSVIAALLLRKQLAKLRRTFFLFDTMGIALYTVIGIEMGMTAGLHPIICIGLGTMTACFGGVIRDILCNEIPVIFHKEIYALACVAGGIGYFGLRATGVDETVYFIIAIAIVILVRTVAVVNNLQLPSLYSSKTDATP